MGTKQVNNDRKNYDIAKQTMGRKNLDDRQLDRSLNELQNDKKFDGKKPGANQKTDTQPAEDRLP